MQHGKGSEAVAHVLLNGQAGEVLEPLVVRGP